MAFNHEHLRELRKQRQLSRQQLADKSGVSARQISRLESSSSANTAVRNHTLNQLAKALGTDTGVLTGDMPLPEDAKAENRKNNPGVPVSVRLWPEVRLAYDLIKRRYGVNRTTISNLAPLLFVLMAEGSFAWRLEKLAVLKEAAEKLMESGNGHLAFGRCAYLALDGAETELKSIENCDLFGKEVDSEAFEFGYDPATSNPFADYLRHLGAKLDIEDIVEIDDDDLLYLAFESLPRSTVCGAELDTISGGSAAAKYALTNGHVRLGDIPEDLLSDDATSKRAEWLEAQLPEDASALFKELDLSGVLNSLNNNEEETKP